MARLQSILLLVLLTVVLFLALAESAAVKFPANSLSFDDETSPAADEHAISRRAARRKPRGWKDKFNQVKNDAKKLQGDAQKKAQQAVDNLGKMPQQVEQGLVAAWDKADIENRISTLPQSSVAKFEAFKDNSKLMKENMERLEKMGGKMKDFMANVDKDDLTEMLQTGLEITNDILTVSLAGVTVAARIKQGLPPDEVDEKRLDDAFDAIEKNYRKYSPAKNKVVAVEKAQHIPEDARVVETKYVFSDDDIEVFRGLIDLAVNKNDQSARNLLNKWAKLGQEGIAERFPALPAPGDQRGLRDFLEWCNGCGRYI
ncbi:hypothetical protein NUU61_007370 [Penicillium alfredii]|uniref:Secreted RxLR effector peptide protein n=1 Tax=Penicillium alfredii TaxID=1506179 RepID=A0A9W9F2X5_9EURO|nr:uncharacterized protein NUU61_007370 [Penicillium alfredii]KAJ5092500.1 hypothetical protein NUU61_007370 [Penicillium alfredii]